jgi:hypothetical protein
MTTSTFKQVAGSAIGSGAWWWQRRSSLRSFTGVVVEVGFPSFTQASTFAQRWAGRVGRSLAVRRLGHGWSVSVPVSREAQ